MKTYLILLSLICVSMPIFGTPDSSKNSTTSSLDDNNDFFAVLVWPFKPFEVLGSYWTQECRKDLDAKLKEKYWPACPPLRFIFRFVHGEPTSYVASAAYYLALLAVLKKVYNKLKNNDEKHDKELGGPSRVCTHENCAWCAMHALAIQGIQ